MSYDVSFLDVVEEHLIDTTKYFAEWLRDTILVNAKQMAVDFGITEPNSRPRSIYNNFTKGDLIQTGDGKFHTEAWNTSDHAFWREFGRVPGMLKPKTKPGGGFVYGGEPTPGEVRLQSIAKEAGFRERYPRAAPFMCAGMVQGYKLFKMMVQGMGFTFKDGK